MRDVSVITRQCLLVGLLLAVSQIGAYRPSQDSDGQHAEASLKAADETKEVSINPRASFIQQKDPASGTSQSAGIQAACDVSGKTDPKEVLQQLRVCTGTLQNIAKKTKEGEAQSRQANEQYVAQFKGVMNLLGKLQDVSKVKDAFTKDQHTAMDFLLGETGKIDTDISTFDEAPKNTDNDMSASGEAPKKTDNGIISIDEGSNTGNGITPQKSLLELQKLAHKAQAVFLQLESWQDGMHS